MVMVGVAAISDGKGGGSSFVSPAAPPMIFPPFFLLFNVVVKLSGVNLFSLKIADRLLFVLFFSKGHAILLICINVSLKW